MSIESKQSDNSIILSDYISFYNSIKKDIQKTQIKAAISVNRELLALYWNIGRRIIEQQRRKGWGNAVVDKLSADLKKDLPGLKGFSRTNLFAMRKWYLFYSKADTKVQQLVGLLPWGHNVIIINKIKKMNEAVFYLRHACENGWSRNMLVHQIESALYDRKSKAVTNFKKTLPSPQSDLASEMLKDPYHFDFLTISEKAKERELQDKLLNHLQEFLLELGVGFAFVDKQKHLEIDGKDFYIDLLFYHTGLHTYVIIELKTGEFKPEYAGKMGFYLSAVDDNLKHYGDNPSIGIILCKTKSKIIVEYALKDTKKPIGVSSYKLTKQLPKNLKSSLPTIKEIEKEVAKTKEIEEKGN